MSFLFLEFIRFITLNVLLGREDKFKDIDTKLIYTKDKEMIINIC